MKALMLLVGLVLALPLSGFVWDRLGHGDASRVAPAEKGRPILKGDNVWRYRHGHSARWRDVVLGQ